MNEKYYNGVAQGLANAALPARLDQPSEIQTWMDRMRLAVAAASSAFDALVAKLAPVLKPGDGKIDKSPESCTSALSPLASDLEGVTDSVAGLRGYIADLTERVAL